MDSDKTVLRPRGSVSAASPEGTGLHHGGTLAVGVLDPRGRVTASYTFAQGFTAGRAGDNAIVVESELVSRHHLAVLWEDGHWWVHDLKSTNGVYVDGRPVVQKARLELPALLLVGSSGIQLRIEAAGAGGGRKAQAPPAATGPALLQVSRAGPQPAESERRLSRENLEARLLADAEDPGASEYTRIVRKVIREDRSRRSRRYRWVIWTLGALFLASAGFVYYQQTALSNARALAIDMFYDIKALEVSLSRADARVEESALLLDQMLQAAVDEKMRVDQERIRAERERIALEKQRLAQEMERLKRMKAKYQLYVQEANALRLRFPTAAQYEEELIARVARAFGESELELPADFVAEVDKYIRTWQGSSRLKNGIANLEGKGYGPIVIAALEKEGLPLHFLYLPLQESNYDNQAVGPETRWGIAKGAWQLLATTGQDYGLVPGPRAGTRDYDEQDARFDFAAATRAAAKHLRLIYSTEAQASGLLVMASYNYGHGRVRNMVAEMPDNPRERNFWKFIQRFQLPKETYDYVFYIFAAAVIGEDPKHFGFNFNPPLLVLR